MAEAKEEDTRHFYHCTTNVADIIISNELAAQTSMGFRNVSLFCEEDGFRETGRYYLLPDNNDSIRLGESVYPIHAAFCFEKRAMVKDVNDGPELCGKGKELIENAGGFENATKGRSEWLYPRSISLAVASVLFSGIRIPTGMNPTGERMEMMDPEGSLVRLIALLYFQDRGDVRIANQNKDFIPAHDYFTRDEFGPLIKLVDHKKAKYSVEDVWAQIANSKTTKEVIDKLRGVKQKKFVIRWA